MQDFIFCPILGIIFLTQYSNPSQYLILDLDLEINTNQLNVIIVIAWVTLQTTVLDIKIGIFLADNQINIGEIILEILNITQTTEQITDTEMIMLLSTELISQNHQCIWNYRQGINSVVPTFKETSDSIEEVFQMQIDNTIESDYSFIDYEPLDIYSRQILYDDEGQDTVYGTNEEFNTLFYDIEQNLDSEASEEQVPDQAFISKFSTFVCTQQNTQSVCLAQVNGKVKRMWVKALFKSDPKINPNFALDMPTYKKTSDVHSFHQTVIHATYLYSDSNLSSDPQLQLHFDGTITMSTLTGLPLHTLLDAGCHKTLLSKKIYDQNKKHFQNCYEIPFLEKHSITVGNGQQIYAHKRIALPLKIQDHYFEFLVLVVDILDEYDFIIVLEAAIQLEAVYHMKSHVVNIQSRSVPLFSNKYIKISPGTSTSIQLTGDLPCTFTSGTAIIRVQPVENGFSFKTIEVEFLDQSTCIHVSNKSHKPVYFYKDAPIAYFDLRLIGYFNPSQAVDMLKMKTPPTYVTSFTALQDASNHRLDNNPTLVMDTQDPYRWLELDASR